MKNKLLLLMLFMSFSIVADAKNQDPQTQIQPIPNDQFLTAAGYCKYYEKILFRKCLASCPKKLKKKVTWGCISSCAPVCHNFYVECVFHEQFQKDAYDK